MSQTVPVVADSDGVLRVVGTRVTLDTVVDAFRDGATAESIAEQYPSLTLADVYTILGYYLGHQAELDQYLQRRRQAAEQARQENEARFSPLGVRDRLLARRKAAG
jgi:uncharacterized protein (DUF433 family)